MSGCGLAVSASGIATAEVRCLTHMSYHSKHRPQRASHCTAALDESPSQEIRRFGVVKAIHVYRRYGVSETFSASHRSLTSVIVVWKAGSP
jgi:hypothetical protein